MSVATEISKLQTNLMGAYSSIESKGGTLPENQNFDNLSTSINSISSGINYTAGTGIDITNDVISVTSDISTGAALGTTAVQPSALNGKADIDLSNITSTSKNIANWSTNVTNCIREIPQDIKLELNDGTLTLKAGSKVYVPNGFNGTTPKFDVVTIENDMVTSSGNNATQLHFYASSGNFWGRAVQTVCYSGDTEPTSASNYSFWYDTANNLIKRKINDNWQTSDKYALPSLIATTSSTGYTSIDQVFNGFGYIGKRNFITNVKLLIAKGYNTDGTYHNQEYIINSPIVARNDFGNNSIMFFRNNGSYQIYNIGKQWYLGELDYVPNVSSTFQWYYNTTNRMWYMHEANEQSWRQVDYANLGINTSTETNFKEVFRAADYDDVVLKQNLATVHCVVETYVNGTSWYRVYDDNWCEQGGSFTCSSAGQILTYLIPFIDTNYTMSASGGTNKYGNVAFYNRTTTQCACWISDDDSFNAGIIDWHACGYIS